jgi:hypothetical protein
MDWFRPARGGLKPFLFQMQRPRESGNTATAAQPIELALAKR